MHYSTQKGKDEMLSERRKEGWIFGKVATEKEIGLLDRPG